MSIIDFKIDKVKNELGFQAIGKDEKGKEYAASAALSGYQPKDEVKEVRSQIVRQFTLGNMTMHRPRREFNDVSVLSRMALDQMSFNVYQPNNGQPYEGDIVNAWKSNAVRPTVRNKCISIAAHATAKLVFPKIFAQNELAEEQVEAAQVMSDLIEWSAEQSDYAMLSLYAVISALVNPASIVYTDYTETFRTVKTDQNNDGTWNTEDIYDDNLSGFQDQVVPVDELYIENFYEHDIQKQGWLLWRKVQSYSLMKLKYENKYKEFKYVKPGVQLIFNDANQAFYEVYDANMRNELCEEIIYWNKAADVKIIMVNGVMLTEYDNPNPRIDKQYPFTKFGYELIDEGKCFYYKSLAFKLQQDANIINTLYQMIIDGTYLNLMPPMINVGGEAITSDVIVPGAVTTLSSPDADLRAIKLSENLQAGMNTLFKVDESVNQSSENPAFPAGRTSKETAYEISKREQEASTLLGLFIKMISGFVKNYGKLRISDILQYITIVDAKEITGDDQLVYKTFLMPEKNVDGKNVTRKIYFTADLPSEPITEKEHLELSHKVYKEEGGKSSKMKLYKVNPEIFRTLKFQCVVTPDVITPMSEDVERAFMLEEYDRAIQNPLLDQEQVTKDFLLSAYPKSKKDVEKYFKKQTQAPTNPLDQIKNQMTQNSMQQQPAQPQGATPLQGMMNIK